MRAVLLVALREFRQIVSTRGFWVMLLIVPVAIGVSVLVSSALAPNPRVAFTLVDASGRYAPQLEQRLERDYQSAVLSDLSAYVERWDLGSVDPSAPWARRDSWRSDAEVARFIGEGGSAAAVERLGPSLPEDAPAFEPPERYFHRIPPPEGVPTDKGAEAFGEAVAPLLKDDVETPDGKMPLGLAVYIPEDFGAPGAAARVWTNGQSINGQLLGAISDELTSALRLDLLESGGISNEEARRIQAFAAPIAVTEPAVGEERSVIEAGSIIPIALVYLLMVTAITTGSMMLQGLVEERSNKLLESVLACVRPAQLMKGKLLGLGGVGLGIVFVWLGCAVVAALYSTGGFADLLRTSLEALDKPWIGAAMIFYFLSGYLVLSMVFLAIGSLSDSMQDAQSYLTPVLLIVMFPVLFMMQASLNSPDSLFMTVLSWIPLYTPFAMLARLGTGVSLAEVLGTVALLVVFIALELALLGRLFEGSVLNAGKPGWRELFAKLRTRPG